MIVSKFGNIVINRAAAICGKLPHRGHINRNGAVMDNNKETSVKVYSTVKKGVHKDFEKLAATEGHTVSSKIRSLIKKAVDDIAVKPGSKAA